MRNWTCFVLGGREGGFETRPYWQDTAALSIFMAMTDSATS